MNIVQNLCLRSLDHCSMLNTQGRKWSNRILCNSLKGHSTYRKRVLDKKYINFIFSSKLLFEFTGWEVSCKHTWTNQYWKLLCRISNTLKRAILYQNIRLWLILFNVTSKTQYTEEFKNNTVTTSLMLNNINGLQISPHNEQMYIMWFTTQPQQEIVSISCHRKIRLKTVGLMQTWPNVKQARWFDFYMWRVSAGVNSLEVSGSVQSMCYVMDKDVDMVQCFQ